MLNRDFYATAPSQKIVTDITEWPACDGKVYLSGLFDCYDNMCLGIAIADNMRTELCIQTYQQAAENGMLGGAISHSDRGSQYTSEAFHQTLASMGILQSMNSAAGLLPRQCQMRKHVGQRQRGSNCLLQYQKDDLPATETSAELLLYYILELSYWNYHRICSAIGGMPPVVKRGHS